MRLTITRTTPVYSPANTSGVFVQWDIIDPPLGGPDIVFAVARSSSPRGPFAPVATHVPHPYYFDGHVPTTSGAIEPWEQRSLTEAVYYRVQAFEVGGSRDVPLAEDVAVVGDRLDVRTQLKRRYMQRMFMQQLRAGASGIPIAIAKLKHWGVRCTRCFDRLTKSVLDQDCLVCLGTGFVGGYYDPVVVLARRGVRAVSTDMKISGNADVSTPAFWMLDYPKLSKADVIIELRTDARYEVIGTAATELRGVPVHQKAEVSELAHSSNAHYIRVPSGAIPSFGY